MCRASGLGKPSANNRAIVLSGQNLKIDIGNPSVVESVTQQVQHPSPRRLVRIVAKLKTESIGGTPNELQHHLNIDAIGWRPICRSTIVNPVETDLTARVDGHAFIPS